MYQSYIAFELLLGVKSFIFVAKKSISAGIKLRLERLLVPPVGKEPLHHTNTHNNSCVEVSNYGRQQWGFIHHITVQHIRMLSVHNNLMECSMVNRPNSNAPYYANSLKKH